MLTEIDSRTSDAIAVGVRFNAPIYSYDEVLEEVDSNEGQDNGEEELFDEEDEVDTTMESELRNASKEELNFRLQEAIENEAYELASKIRDELNRRGK
jgi:hypothetical protein